MASQDRMQKVLNSHGQENQFFNDHHKIIANNIFKSCFYGNCTSEHLLGKIKGIELTFENLACVHTVVSLRP